MKGWLVLLVVAGCAIGGALYFNGAPQLTHVDERPAPASATPVPEVSEPGPCRLSTSVRVSSAYGAVTLPPGTEVQYLGKEGVRILVARGELTFSVTANMVTGLEASGAPPAVKSLPEQQGIVAGDATPEPQRQGFLSTLGTRFFSWAPWVHHEPAGVPSDPAFDFQKYAPFLLIASGAEGRASGVLVRYQGKVRLVTNAHVLSGIPDARFSLINSQEVPTGPFSYADGADLAVADQNSATQGIEMMTDVDKEVRVGDDVVVLGNSLGSDVVTVINGKVTGLGPDLVEVDAKFVEGNSGSPIIHVKTGKMIGIATFAQMRRVDLLSKDSQFASGIRRFGYRLDTVRNWEHPTAWRFQAEAQQLQAIRKKTEYLYYLARDISNNSVNLSKYQGGDSPLKTVITQFTSDNGGLHPSSIDQRESILSLVRALSYETQSDILPLRREQFTWFHWHELEMDMEMRTELKKAYDQMLSVAQSRLDNPFR